MSMKFTAGCFAVMAANAQIAKADECVFGVGGYDHLDDVREETVAVKLEYHTAPFWNTTWSDLSWIGVVQGDTSENVFAGAGAHALYRISGSRAFLEASFSFGAMRQHNGSVKQADNFLFHTSIGAGVLLDQSHRLSISLDHFLNSNLKNHRPGTESILLRFTMQF